MAPLGLQFYSYFYPQSYIWKSFEWRGIRFNNRLGTAGGFDKEGLSIKPLYKIGLGFSEIGTITPLPQKANPGKIIDRDWETKTLWNKMGFPNAGVECVVKRLQISPSPFPLFINVGKNRQTTQEKAHEDYLYCVQKMESFGSSFVINISSPNTQGLRDLQNKAFLERLISPLKEITQKPLLLKLSPDMDDSDLINLVERSIDIGVDGFILTNTTARRKSQDKWPMEGGLSGAPLRDRSEAILQTVVKQIESHREKPLIISVGGVLTPHDVSRRLDMGADLVQVYSAFVFQGFGFVKNVADFMRESGKQNEC